MLFFRKIFISLIIFSGLGLGCTTQRPSPQAAIDVKCLNSQCERPQPPRNWTFAEYFPKDLELELPCFPAIWPTQGWVTSDYGMRDSPIRRERRFHDGMDIAAPLGSPIFATADAVVSFSGNKGGYGRVLILDHGLGFSTLYAHASKIFAKQGDFVRQGQIIAAVGRSGDTTGPHLHYEVHVGGKVRDPRAYGLVSAH